jgi:hypothetical protein
MRKRGLLAGIQVFEDTSRKIFGTDLLGQNYFGLSANVAIQFSIKLDLIPGDYVAGFAVFDVGLRNEMPRLLGCWHRLVDFQIVPQPLNFDGVARLDSTVRVEELQC